MTLLCKRRPPMLPTCCVRVYGGSFMNIFKLVTDEGKRTATPKQPEPTHLL
jgi:hypothetical protein